MCNQYRSSALHQITERCSDLLLTLHIQITGCLIQKQIIRITHHGSCNSDTLLLTSHSAEQLALCGSACYFLSGGSIYRIYDDETQLIRTGSVTWLGAYGSRLYYLEGGMIYRCDVNGQNSQLLDSGSGDVCLILRTWQDSSIIIAINPSANDQDISVDAFTQYSSLSGQLTCGTEPPSMKSGTLQLPAWSVAILTGKK